MLDSITQIIICHS